MKETTTLENVRQRALAHRRSLSQEVISTKSFLMDPLQPGRMIVRRPGGLKEDSYQFDERCYTQAPSVVYGLPGSYLQKLVESEHSDPHLAAMNFNHWVKADKDRDALLLFRTNEEGEKILRAILPSSWNNIPYDETIATMIAKLGPDREVEVMFMNENRMVLDVITKKLDYKANPSIRVKIDDPIEWGFRVADSDVGISNLTIAPFIKRLRCTNGATVTSEGVVMTISHKGKQSLVPEAVQSNVRQGIEMIDGYSQSYCDQITQSQEILLRLGKETNYPDGAIARIVKDFAITKLEEKYIRESWDKESETIEEPSVWRLHNAITRAGTHGEELRENERLHLQGVGGKVLELTSQNYLWN